MRLALFSGSYPPVEGAGARLIRMFEPMSKDNDVHIFVLGDKLENKNFKDGNFYVHEINVPLSGIPKIGWIITKILKNPLIKSLKNLGRFDAIFLYRPDLSSLAVSASKRFSIPLFSDYPDLELYKDNIIERIVITRIFKKRFRNSRHIFPITSALKDRLINFYKIPEERITVIPNGVNTEAFNPLIDGSKIKERLGLSDSFVIGYTGALKEWIRLDVLFEAFKKLKMDYDYIKLLIVGGQDLEIKKWKRISGNLGIENDIVFVGSVPYTEIPEYITSFDIAVSIFSKSLFTDVASPLKVIEYMSMGKAVIADDLSGTREFIKNKENGILFVPEDAKSLENAVRVILDDEILKSELEKNARKTALNYDWKRLSRRMEEIMIENL